MKSVTKISLDELALVMPAICEMNQRYYVGGYSGNTGDSGGWGGNPGGYGDSGGWGGNSGGTGDYGSGSGYSGGYYGSSEGWSGDPGQYGSSIYDGINSGNYNGDSGEYSDPSRAVSYDRYVILMSSGSWRGGYVEGIGYVGSVDNGGASNEVVVIGDKRVNETFNFTKRDYELVENVGMRSLFGVKGGVVVENGNITVLASGKCEIDGAIFSGRIELLVYGNVVESHSLCRSSGESLLQGGYQEIGSASFNKAKYGNANVQVCLIVSYNNNNYDGTGYWASNELREIVYTSKNE